MIVFHIAVFLLLQIGAALLFKWGSTAPHLYWKGFAGGNLLGMTSILCLILIYRELNANLAAAVSTGGSFLLIQIALSLVFRTVPGPLQVTGGFLIAAGIGLMALGGK